MANLKWGVFLLLVSFTFVAWGQNTPICTADLPGYIQSVTDSPAFSSSRFGVHVRAFYPDETTGRVLYADRDNEYFIPASNTKLFTAAAALSKYSSDWTFVTRVRGETPEPSVPLEQWDQLNISGPAPAIGRLYAKAVITADGLTYLWGGQDGNGGRPNAFSVLDTNSNVWQPTPVTSGTTPAGRLGHAMTLTADQQEIFIFGGSGAAGRLNDVQRFSLSSNTWLKLNTTGTKPDVRSLACAIPTNFNTVLIFGGSQGFTKFFNDVWKYDLLADSWTKVSPKGTIPSARSGMSCVMDGDVAIIFGGHVSSTAKLNEILRYDTATNTWLSSNASSGLIPEARTTHTAVLTPQREMLVFGGSGFGGDIGSTAKYNVDSNTWSIPMPAGNPPSARDSPVAVFNANLGNMIVWGGVGSVYHTDLYNFHYLAPGSQDGEKTSVNEICIIGQGDPTQTTASVQQIAAELISRRVNEIGTLYIDSKTFKGNYEPGQYWSTSDLTGSDATSPGPFVVNRNAFTFTLKPGSGIGSPAVFSPTDPLEQGAPVVNNQVTTGATTSVKISYAKPSQGLSLSGTVASTFSSSVSIYPSVPHYAQLAKNVLNAANISVAEVKIAKCPGGPQQILKQHSEPLYNLLQTLLQQSDNLYAESMLRRMGSDSEPSFESDDTVADGIAEILRLLNASMPEVDWTTWNQTDGSGLSRNNFVTPQTVAALLEGVQKMPFANEFKSFLPVAGLAGTLSTRFPVGSAGRGVVSAKTGSLSGVSALSGYIRADDVTPSLAFSIIFNGPSSVSVTTQRNAIDQIANYLARWRDC